MRGGNSDDEPAADDRDENDAGGTDDEGEWRFGIDDVGPNGVTEDTSTRGPIEPGDIRLEHAVFVAVGVVLALGVLLSAII